MIRIDSDSHFTPLDPFASPFYECVEGLGVPLLVHGVDSGPLLGVERYARFNLDVCLGFSFEVFTAISAMIFSGVVDRFPKLAGVSSKSASGLFLG